MALGRGNVMPNAYEEGVEIGRDLYREGVSIASVAPLSGAARRYGYRGPEVRQWVQGVIHGYASEQDCALTARTTTTEGGT